MSFGLIAPIFYSVRREIGAKASEKRGELSLDFHELKLVAIQSFWLLTARRYSKIGILKAWAKNSPDLQIGDNGAPPQILGFSPLATGAPEGLKPRKNFF